MKEVTKVKEAADFIQAEGEGFSAEIAFITGASQLKYEVIKEIPLSIIPNFPYPVTEGFKGILAMGLINGTPCYIINGRAHSFEGYQPSDIARPIRVFKELGVKKIISINSASAVNLDFEPGEMMLITDHINFSGDNPLQGMDSTDFGPKFPNMQNAYSGRIQDVFRQAALDCELPLNEGVFLRFSGPSFETPAEVRIARALGADMVGFSTVYECIAAVQSGIEFGGISCIIHMAAGIADISSDFDSVIEICSNNLNLLIQMAMPNL
jgi:purine-nucleoside phosphorylase